MRPAAPTAYDRVSEELDRRRRVALGFERIEALLHALGDPHRALLRVVQVVGTNGKGTTSLALASALEEAGHPSGAYLSPHVLSYTERVWMRGSYASEEEFAAGMGAAIRAADESGIPATQFELLTAGALLMFRDAGLPWAVLEAGLGARHDATSAAGPGDVVLTNVALDHTEYLGETVEEIAREKLASLRPGAKLLLGTDDPRVRAVAEHEAERAGAELILVGGVREEEIAGFGFGRYAARDVGLGFVAAETLLGRALSHGDRRRAARRVLGALPGRFEEFVVGGVPVVVDGGHNPEGLAATFEAVRSRYGGRPLAVVFGALRDKDVAGMLGTVEREAGYIFLTRPGGSGGRAAEPEELLREYEPKGTVGEAAVVVGAPVEALDAAVDKMGSADGVVLVTGSLYTAAGVLGALRREDRRV